jgi:hypothetical protein
MSQTCCQKQTLKTFRVREFVPVSNRTADILLVRFVPSQKFRHFIRLFRPAVDSSEGGTDSPMALARLAPD